MEFTVVIPARYQSSRLPGKPLAEINGKSMIQRVHEQATLSGAQRVLVATDDQRIEEHVGQFGGEAIITSAEHQTGTDRIQQACELAHLNDQQIIVNVQGDEPFIEPSVILQVAQLLHRSSFDMTTLCVPIFESEEVNNPNTVKVVFDNQSRAIYFSRAGIPFDRDNQVSDYKASYYRHIGIYAYRKNFLDWFAKAPESRLERIEKLEQLRVIESGKQIGVELARKPIKAGVDTPTDLDNAINYAIANDL